MAIPFLSRFTPSLMDAQTLEAVFVQRERLAQRIVETIRDNALGGSQSHTLLVGPRGIGKTHLLSLIYYRLLALPELTGSLRIAWLREEEWGVGSFLDLLLRILRVLAESDPSLQPEIDALYTQTQVQATRAAHALLEQIVSDRPLLLMMENMNEIFSGLGTNGQQELRSFLQETGQVILLASAQGLFPEISRQSAPFYGFLRVEHLAGLTLDDAVALLTKIADREQQSGSEDAAQLVDYLKTANGRARVRAVHHLAGGNPRVYVIFSEFLTRDSLDALVSPFLKMLDELTPYYQSRMKELSAQQRKIVEILVEARGAIPVKEIAQRGFMTHQTVSSQLKDLRGKGYVLAHSIGRESFYELQEPLMRLCLEVKKQRGEPIKLFVEFLRLWCSEPELQRRLEVLPDDADFTRRCLQEAIRVSAASEDPVLTAVMHDLNLAITRKNEVKILEAAEEMTEIAPNDAYGWYCRGLALMLFNRNNEALPFLNKSTELEPHDDNHWLALGHLHFYLDDYVMAARTYRHAFEIMPSSVAAHEGYVRSLERLGSYDEELVACENALAQKIKTDIIRYGRIRALMCLGQWTESLRLLMKEHYDPRDILPVFAQNIKKFLVYSPVIWQKQIKTFTNLYIQHKAVSAIGTGLIQSIHTLTSSQISPDARRLWLTTWQKALAGQPEAELPLRMLETAIRYGESGDPPDERILLELPAEQRELLQPLLIQTETDEGLKPSR